MTNLRQSLVLCLKWLDEDCHVRFFMIGLLTLAFILRLSAALLIPIDYRFQGDAVEYVSDARHLLTIGVFGEEPGIPYATIPPGYPLLIAGVFALTNQSLMAVRLAQVILGTVMVWLTYLVGREAASRRVSLLGAFISAVYPAWIIYPSVFLTETLYTVLFLLFILCLIRSLKTYKIVRTIATGVTFGLALLTREVLFMFPLLLPFALWWSRVSERYAWRYLLLFATTMLLTLSPWLARNYLTFGQIFYTERIEAIRYQLTGSGYLAPRYEHLANETEPPQAKKSPEYYERFGRSSDMYNLKNLFTNPTTYLRYIANRLAETWLHPNGLESLPENLIVRAAYIILNIGMLGLACIGIIYGLKRRDIAIGLFVLLLTFTTCTILFFTGPNPRYILPYLPLVFVLTAIGADMLLLSVSQRIGISYTG